MGRISLLFLSLLPSTLSIPQPPKRSPLDIHINIDVAETSFDFASEYLTMDTMVTLSWIDEGNPYLPKKQGAITHLEGEFEWPLDLQFSDMWIPPVKRSMEEDEFRRSRMKMSEATFFKNGSVDAKYFYTSLIPCMQHSLSFPWDEYHCGIYLSNMESERMYTLTSKNRDKPFNISYSRPMNQHRIIKYDSTFKSSLVRSKNLFFRVHGVQFDCVVRRDQPRIIYSNVIPALSLIFFDAYVFITNQTSPLYNLLLVIPLLLQIQFFAKLLVNKLPYLVVLLVARTFLSILTSLGRLLMTILDSYFPDQVKNFKKYDTALNRIAFVVASTFFVFVAIDYTL